jgi:molybdenum cofactor cytidylyltransferase
MRDPAYCAVILAAGESTRMGSDKALLPWQGGTFLSAAIDAFDPFADYVIVVAGSNASRLEPVVDTHGAYLVSNPEPRRGQFSSLQVGLREVLNRGRDTAIVALVDHPAPARETLARMRERFTQAAPQGKWALVPQYRGRHGHPIILGPELLVRLLAEPPETSARDVLHRYQDRIDYLEIEDPRIVTDIDTPEQYSGFTAEGRLS